jgi:hypothetical protein
MKLAYSVQEAAAASGLSTRQLDRAIAAGDLSAKLSSPKKKDAARGGKRLILAAELERYLSELADAS